MPRVVAQPGNAAMESHNTFGNWIINGISVSTIITAMLGFIPSIAALVAATYYAVQIWESETVKAWRKRRLRRKLLVLHQRAGELELQLVDTTDRETLDHLKKSIAMRVDIDAGLQKRETLHDKANAAMIAAAQEKQSPPLAAHDKQTP